MSAHLSVDALADLNAPVRDGHRAVRPVDDHLAAVPGAAPVDAELERHHRQALLLPSVCLSRRCVFYFIKMCAMI